MTMQPAEGETKTFSRDKLILPETILPQEVSDILQRAEKAGLTVFEPYHLSDVTLQQDSNVEGWNKKPGDWYWEQIKRGNISQDAAKLPGAWVLIDKTARPNYGKDDRQLYESDPSDPFGPLLKQLRKEGKIHTTTGIPDSSRAGIHPDELAQVVLPAIAKLLGVEASAVRLPKAMELNVIGNLKHPEWGTANTFEWFNDVFEGTNNRLIGGSSDSDGLSNVGYFWPGHQRSYITFRPLLVVSPKA